MKNNLEFNNYILGAAGRPKLCLYFTQFEYFEGHSFQSYISRKHEYIAVFIYKAGAIKLYLSVVFVFDEPFAQTNVLEGACLTSSLTPSVNGNQAMNCFLWFEEERRHVIRL